MDNIIACDAGFGRDSECFSEETGKSSWTFKSNITRVASRSKTFNEVVWSLDKLGVKKFFMIENNKPFASELIEKIIIPNFLQLTNSNTLKEALSKGFICSLNCLFCLNEINAVFE